jgi:hypothetical protein
MFSAPPKTRKEKEKEAMEKELRERKVREREREGQVAMGGPVGAASAAAGASGTGGPAKKERSPTSIRNPGKGVGKATHVDAAVNGAYDGKSDSSASGSTVVLDKR